MIFYSTIKRFSILAAFGALTLMFTPALTQANAFKTSQMQSKDYPFKSAFEAAREANWSIVDTKKSRIKDHELLPYVEFHEIKQRLPNISTSQIKNYKTQYANTPLAGWLINAAIRSYGEAQEWNRIIAITDDTPNDTVLQCYYYRAHLNQASKLSKKIAKQGAKNLWLNGKSMPDECDPLFNHFIASKDIGNDLTWQRALLALEAGNSKMAKYLGKKLTGQWQTHNQLLLSFIDKPKSLIYTKTTIGANKTPALPFVIAGMKYLSGKNAEDGLVIWGGIQKRFSLDEEQTRDIDARLAKAGVRYDLLPSAVDKLLVKLGDRKLIEYRLRETIDKSQWQSVLYWTQQISGDDADESSVLYWKARAYEVLGSNKLANEDFTKAAQQRNFYGFLAADRIGQAYAMNLDKSILVEADLYANMDTIDRIAALKRIDEHGLAISESNWLLGKHPEHASTFAHYAHSKGWYNLAINATIKGKLWNNVEQRFPLAHVKDFTSWARQRDVDPFLLMAIARRESALNPNAISRVGARGLMQVMPATGKQIAKQLEIKHKGTDALLTPDYNVQLASFYVRDLLDKYDGNRIAMLSGYNAGPHRINAWLNRKPIAFDQFIETIPFRETRNYVKAVLTYRVILSNFGKQAGLHNEDITLLTAKERSKIYGN